MIVCTRIIEFDAAHRVMNHESKCNNLHGHRYSVHASFTANSLDSLGRIIDFGIIKELLGNWINDNWDHNTILYEKDFELGKSIEAQTGQSIFYLAQNPTAENIADYLLNKLCPKLFAEKNVKCVAIKLYETPNCYAEVVL
ncbi:MAG: 6-carboxytetrahydropterin synthase [Pseudomonadota bacterium]